MKRLISLILLNLISPKAMEGQAITPSFGTIQSYFSFPSQYVEPRQVDVWLPPNYSSEKEYSVLYMHDGQMLFDSTQTWNHQEWGVDETMAELEKNGYKVNCIVVGVWNAGPARHSEYFPQKPFEQLPKHFQDSLLNLAKRNPNSYLFSKLVQSDNYLLFLTSELKPFIDSTYSTLKNPQNTLIAGSSMGGLISMYAVCEYPNVFGGAACLSTHWPGTFTVNNNPIPTAFLNYLKSHLPSPENHKFYFDFGTETLDALYEPFQVQADEILRNKGYNTQNWITQKWEGADHSEQAWKARLATPLQFLLKNKN